MAQFDPERNVRWTAGGTYSVLLSERLWDLLRYDGEQVDPSLLVGKYMPGVGWVFLGGQQRLVNDTTFLPVPSFCGDHLIQKIL